MLFPTPFWVTSILSKRSKDKVVQTAHAKSAYEFVSDIRNLNAASNRVGFY